MEDNPAESFAGAKVRVGGGAWWPICLLQTALFWSLKVSMADSIHAISFKSCKGTEGVWWMWPSMVKQMSCRRKASDQEVGSFETKRHLAGQRSQKKAAMMRSMVDRLV